MVQVGSQGFEFFALPRFDISLLLLEVIVILPLQEGVRTLTLIADVAKIL